MYEILAAFLVGLASFFSPCILPVAPGFVSALAGTVQGKTDISKRQGPSYLKQSSVYKPQEVEHATHNSRKIMFISTGYFVLGFALVFALIGTIIACFCTSNSVIGLQIKHFIAYTGGFIMLGMGIYMILTTKIARLNFQKIISLEKIKGMNIQTAYITSFVFGATFAAGWTPCVGPLLASILTLAVEHPEIAYNELLVYALGIGTPFLIISLFLTDVQRFMRPLVKRVRSFDYIMGGILIVIGIWFLYQQFADPIILIPT